MKGNNTLQLNQETVLEAVQLYFDTVLFREGRSPKAVSISEQRASTYGHSFEVVCESTDEPCGVVMTSAGIVGKIQG